MSIKMLREALCREHLRASSWPPIITGHVAMLIKLIDLHRPLDSSGTHGNLHTPTCGCEDKDLDQVFPVGRRHITQERDEMALPVKKYVHKPLYVDAIQVTTENMDEVAHWCEGKVIFDEQSGLAAHIKVEVLRPQQIRQTQAFVGDWVLRTGTGLKVYSAKAFSHTFFLVEEMDPKVTSRLEEVFSDK